MKHIFVCCDGTWNAPTAVHDGVPVPTNVVRFYNCIAEQAGKAPDAIRQLRYYHPGIGASGSMLRRIYEGATGSGISQHIRSAYKWLGDNFRPEDKMFLVGFSRGAYTVRSLVGLLHRVGLIERPTWDEVADAYGHYRRNRSPNAVAELDAFRQRLGGRLAVPPVHFVGVWDTVGALGIPLSPPLSWIAYGLWRNQFHDTSLSSTVRNAYHAVAIDEQRASFAPTLWTVPAQGTLNASVEQAWFPGVHADVGGGYREIGLSDGALDWMLQKATTANAEFDLNLMKQIRPDPQGALHDSYRGIFGLARSEPRSMPFLGTAPPDPPPSQTLHSSVVARRSNPPIAQCPYRTSRRLAVGERACLPVFAREPWNWTGLFVSRGETYEFSVPPTQEWRDGVITCNGGGYTRWWMAPVAWMKRLPRVPWFCLSGAVGDAGNPTVTGVPARETMFPIGLQQQWSSTADGYLYLFANDVDGFYFNNRGGLEVTVVRAT
jgi:hypothetical protein